MPEYFLVWLYNRWNNYHQSVHHLSQRLGSDAWVSLCKISTKPISLSLSCLSCEPGGSRKTETCILHNVQRILFNSDMNTSRILQNLFPMLLCCYSPRASKQKIFRTKLTLRCYMLWSEPSTPPQTMCHELLTILLIPDEVRDAEGGSQLQFHIGVTLNHREEKQMNYPAGERKEGAGAKDRDKGETNNSTRTLRQAIKNKKTLKRTEKQ